MFYPDICRRVVYSTKHNGEYYATYTHYTQEITEDCAERCVYCDITLPEQGGEGMQLDHFRPQELFDDLKSDPKNLVLSCQKCNRLKSDHWPVKKEIELDGFLDPFTSDRYKWYSIKSCGTIERVQSHAVGLMIDLLNLNRPARVQLRRKRLLEKRAKDINEVLNQKLHDLVKIMSSDEIDNGSKVKLLENIISLKDKMDGLRTL